MKADTANKLIGWMLIVLCVGAVAYAVILWLFATLPAWLVWVLIGFAVLVAIGTAMAAAEEYVTKQLGPLETRPRSRYIPNDVKAEAMRRDGGRCRKCGSTKELHFDHIIPYSRGGTNDVGNIQVLCGRCNRRKSNR